MINPLKSSVLGLCLFASFGGMAADSPYANTRVDLADTQIVQEFPKNNFLESLLSAEDGSVYVSSAFTGVIYTLVDGKYSVLTDYEGKLQGITFMSSSKIMATGTTPDGQQMVAEIDITTGKLQVIAIFPDGKKLNGLMKFSDNEYLIADSVKGVIWLLNVSSGNISLWADDDLLKGSEAIPLGANGIKRFKDDIYVTNTGKMLLVKIPVIAGKNAGNVEIIKDRVFLDDFTLDNQGNVYGATHVFHSVIKITNTGDVSIIAQRDQGVAGSTAVVWKSDDKDTLLVSSHGDMKNKNKSEVEPGRIVQIHLSR